MLIKNKKNLIAVCLLSFFVFISNPNAEEFNITAKEIVIDKENEIIVGKGSVQAQDLEGKLIYANKITYEKSREFLLAEGKVKIIDNEGNILKTNKATYDKINEIIVTYDSTELILKEGYKLNTKNILYRTTKKMLTSDEKSIFTDIDGNIIETTMFQYDIENNLFSSIGEIRIIDINKNKYFFKEIHVDTNKKEMRKLGLNALLGVGQGSVNETYLAIIEWNGKKDSKQNPLAFVGKGVCFDTGGISLKPARFMEEMKYDMAGSAVVVGLLKSFALRKAKINAVGVVGLVENMPGGNAQRPGDIVKSYSGKTIEVLNTDAEGRLVLADALTFTEKKYKPKFIIDLATLTGAIIVSLGEEYAGLFSNNDELSKNIFKASENVNEKVWRLPLHKNYDKLIDSKIADVQNINYAGGAGSITAAQFLQRFIINKTPWAHLDIAGMAFSKKAANLNPGGATGFGVRLLNNLVKEYYE